MKCLKALKMYERKTIESPVQDFQKKIRKLPSINVDLGDVPPIFTKKEQDLIDKIKKWALVVTVILIIGYAMYRFFFG